jgi:tetratricopeptide (TPR) repeat protein
MPVRTSLFRVLGVAFVVLMRPLTADAQLQAFVEGIREVADANGRTDAFRATALRAGARRLQLALVEWDRQIADLEAAVARQIRSAPDTVAYQLHVQLGVAYAARARRADSLREFDAAAALKPSASDLQVLRALTYETEGRTDEARQAFLLAWRAAPRDPVKAYYVTQRPGAGERDRARAVLTETYRNLALPGAPPAALPFVVLDAFPDSLAPAPVVGDDATAPAFALLGARRYREGIAALEHMDRPQAEHPDRSPLTLFARAQRDEAENRVAEARREYEAALGGTLVGRSAILIGVARLAQVDGDPAAASDALIRASRLNPNDPIIRKELADAYVVQGRADDAFCELMAALLIDPRDAQAHAAIGQVYLDAGRTEEAVTAFDRAIQLTPDRFQIRYALATALTRLGRSTEAARQFDIFERMRRENLGQRRRAIAAEVGIAGEQDDGRAPGALATQGPGR